MTKKEKLINWARKKFENDKDGKILLIQYKLKNKFKNIGDVCIEWYLDCYARIIGNFDLLLLFLEGFSDRLIELEHEKPPSEGNIFYSNLVEYNIIVESLDEYDIDIDDIGISDYYWKSSEDIKYFEEGEN